MATWGELRLSSRKSKLAALMAFDCALAKKMETHLATSLHGVIGLDEVGRGSLIGPVVAGAVVFYQPLMPTCRQTLFDLDDSKAPHLNHAKRSDMADYLKTMTWWGLGEASQAEVEKLNVYYASLLAGHRALQALLEAFNDCLPHHHLLVLDGKQKLAEWPHPQTSIVKADSQSAAVAAASILAKAHRDAWAKALATEYPHYGWETNAGYGTPGHRKAMDIHGLTPHHRHTFKQVQQVSLFESTASRS